jgi:death on curing protein
MDPVFLVLNEVLRIHRDQIERYGGDPGIRDLGLLESAVAMPQAGFGGSFLHHDLFEMAAAYLFHIAMNHPFIDGNKRAGTATALVFLEVNDIEVNASQDELADMVLAVAQGQTDKTAIAEFFRRHSRAEKKGKG